ncbi:MAG: TIGR03032 family protein, partial [Pseudomonadota bacterium]
MSLPHLLSELVETIPAEVPYLGRSEWKNEQLLPVEQFKIGIAWGGSPTQKNDHNRSSQLIDWLPVLRTPGVTFYSLQKGPRTEELSTLPDDVQVLDLDSQLNTFGDTAKFILQMDLMISVDTSVAHLSGALGQPVWTALCYMPDWRWLMDRNDSPWYPTMRLFGQTQPKVWADVFERIAQALAEVTTQHGRR